MTREVRQFRLSFRVAFLDTRRCGLCKQQRRVITDVVSGDLSLRLVLQTDSAKSMPAYHTNDITFQCDRVEEGKEVISRSTAT